MSTMLGLYFNFSNTVMLKMFFIAGGLNESRLDSTEIYDPELASWRAGAALPSEMSTARAANIDGRVLIFGINILQQEDSYKRLMIYLQVVMMAMALSWTLSWSMTSLLTPTRR